MFYDLSIRELAAADCAPISAAFLAQGWNKPVSQYQRYFEESMAGSRTVLVARAGGDFAGYLTIVWRSEYPPFQEAGIPEIVDFNVLIRFRRQGIGTALMHEAEQRIAARSPVSGIGVGMTPDYGPAQILYVRRGYVPDGRSLFAAGRQVQYGECVTVDDGLVLYLTKQLR